MAVRPLRTAAAYSTGSIGTSFYPHPDMQRTIYKFNILVNALYTVAYPHYAKTYFNKRRGSLFYSLAKTDENVFWCE